MTLKEEDKTGLKQLAYFLIAGVMIYITIKATW